MLALNLRYLCFKLSWGLMWFFMIGGFLALMLLPGMLQRKNREKGFLQGVSFALAIFAVGVLFYWVCMYAF